MITCAECKWRVESHCRRYPPQLLRPLDGAFPSIKPDWWCGEAAAKQPTEESNTTPYVPAKSLGQVMREWDEMPDAKPKPKTPQAYDAYLGRAADALIKSTEKARENVQEGEKP